MMNFHQFFIGKTLRNFFTKQGVIACMLSETSNEQYSISPLMHFNENLEGLQWKRETLDGIFCLLISFF
jgi:hypothetical protein